MRNKRELVLGGCLIGSILWLSVAKNNPLVPPANTQLHEGTLAFIAGPSATYPVSSNIYVADLVTGQYSAITENQSDAVYGSVSWSPVGNRLAYSLWSDRRRSYGNFGNYHIFALDLAAKTAKQITDGESDQLPTWSPDGSKIAFITVRNNHYGIYVMNSDGSNAEPLSPIENPGFCWWLSFSPDGQTLAFLLDNDATCPLLFTVKIDGSELRQWTYSPECNGITLSWSPDSHEIAFTRQDGYLYVLSLSTEQVVLLAQIKDAYIQNPTWAPDGKSIAFVRLDDPNSVPNPQAGIYLVNSDGSDIRPAGFQLANMRIDSLTWQSNQHTTLATPEHSS